MILMVIMKMVMVKMVMVKMVMVKMVMVMVMVMVIPLQIGRSAATGMAFGLTLSPLRRGR